MIIVHLTSSTFYGGPERQMLGMAASLPAEDRTVFLSFAEGGRCRIFLDRCRREGFEALGLEHDTPYFRGAIRELTEHLRRLGADVLCSHGYKANLLGRVAARRVGIPVVAVSRGWTRENRKVGLYEMLDRIHLKWMDRVVCVSEGQAAKVRGAGMPAGRVEVIHNSIRPERFTNPDPYGREGLLEAFPTPPTRIVGAAGRLSPEKGFAVLVEAAAIVTRSDPTIGFVLYGDGPLRGALARQIAAAGLEGRFLLGGFRDDLDRLLPHLDLFVLSSFTEGLPNVVLEAFAARVPVVATAVGGTPEVIEEGVSGYLVPPGSPAALARRIRAALTVEAQRREMGDRAQERVRRDFSFEAQALSYRRLFEDLVCQPERLDAGVRWGRTSFFSH